MAAAGFRPDSGNTRPLFEYLSGSISRPPEAWEVLKGHFEDGHTIQVAGINVIIEAHIAQQQFEQALEVYKQLHIICETGPNIETFNILLQGAERSKLKESAMFLASELVALGIKPDHLTYDRLIMVCLNEKDYEDAFNYLEEMVEVGKDKFEDSGRKGWWMRKGTALAMAQQCATHNDMRGKQILEQAVERNLIDDWYANKLYEELYGDVRPHKWDFAETSPTPTSEVNVQRAYEARDAA
ncbi:putative Pentatricopeptide repeat-containing protein [Glarea lozoyensis 74030]|nr:putative Pentatricopeptide repeat-containing protein [Glarea lozoyensis 74030]